MFDFCVIFTFFMNRLRTLFTEFIEKDFSGNRTLLCLIVGREQERREMATRTSFSY